MRLQLQVIKVQKPDRTGPLNTSYFLVVAIPAICSSRHRPPTPPGHHQAPTIHLASRCSQQWWQVLEALPPGHLVPSLSCCFLVVAIPTVCSSHRRQAPTIHLASRCSQRWWQVLGAYPSPVVVGLLSVVGFVVLLSSLL